MGARTIQQKDLFCWHCLKWIRWLPNPHQIQDMQDLLQRPHRERQIIMPAHGIDPVEVSIDPHVRAREEGVHQLNPWAKYPSLLNLLDGAIDWRAEQGSYVPYCSKCRRSLLHQNKLADAKIWVMYPLLIVALTVFLWLLMDVLGRDVLLWG